MRCKLTTLFIILFSNLLIAQQNNSNITLSIKKLNSKTIYLAEYNGFTQQIIDTANLNNNGDFIFSINKKLNEGLYFIVSQNNKYLFDFIIDTSCCIKISCDINDLQNSFKSNNISNQLFIDYQKFITKQREENNYLKNKLTEFADNPDTIKVIKNKLQLLDNKVNNKIDSIVLIDKNSFLSKFINGLKEIKYPIKEIKTRSDTLELLLFLRNHFFDNIDFNNSRMLRAPYLSGKIQFYFNNLVPPIADTIINEIDILMKKAENSKEIYSFLSLFLLNEFDKKQMMGLDAVFVHMSKEFISKNLNIDTVIKKSIIQKSAMLEPLLIGKNSPNIILNDTANNPKSLYDLNSSYIIIYFWNPNCSYCNLQTPHLIDFYKKYKNKIDIEVYAVCVDGSIEEMKEHLKIEKTTWINVYALDKKEIIDMFNISSSPMIYLLDNNKTIIAKQILTDKVKEFLTKERNIKFE